MKTTENLVITKQKLLLVEGKDEEVLVGVLLKN